MIENTTHREGTLKGLYGKKIYHQAWVPEGTPRAVLLLVHGLKEHSGRYGNLVDHFTPLGYAIYGYDQPGHGRSGGTRTYIDEFREFTETLNTYTQLVKERQPGIPIFLYGHSLGTLISLAHLPDHQRDYQGAIFSGTLFSIPQGTSPITIMMGKVFSSILPKMRILPVDEEGLSRDPQVVDDYRQDPLVFGGKTTARLGVEMLNTLQVVQDLAREIRLPTLILQGSADRLVDPGGAQNLYKVINSPDKTLHMYEGYYHELHNEPADERRRVFQDIETWLRRQLSSS